MIKNGKMTTKSTIFHNPAPAHEITVHFAAPHNNSH
jgi:hypothetical protein